MISSENLTSSTGASTIGEDLASRAASAVTVQKEAIIVSCAINAASVGSDSKATGTHTTRPLQDFVGSAARHTVLVGIDVAVGADLAASVHSGESLKASAGVGG